MEAHIRELEAVDQLLADAIRGGATTGAAACVVSLDGVRHLSEQGHAQVCPRNIPVRPGQVWDLASLTKVLGTTAICMALVDRGLLELDAHLADLLPGAPSGVTPRHCLSHSTGWPAWARFFDAVEATDRPWGTRDTRWWIFERAWRLPVEAPVGVRHRYSDVGMIALGAYLERLTGERLDQLWHRVVGRPTGVDLRWGWPGAAATEDCPLRGRVLSGEVHDLNAAVLGGIAAHAGLFGSAEAVAELGLSLLQSLRGKGWLKPETVRAFATHVGPGSHHLGFDGISPGASSAGPLWPEDGIGHLGFTGCSLWMAPTQGVAVALLANRVHPNIEGGAVPGAPLHPRYRRFKALRPAVHTAVVQALQAAGRWT